MSETDLDLDGPDPIGKDQIRAAIGRLHPAQEGALELVEFAT